jgi:predicted  nucleic acid-binding Zn-ribbon protein
MSSTRRFRRTIIDGGPHFLHSYPYDKLEQKMAKAREAASSAAYSLKMKYKEVARDEDGPLLRERYRKVERLCNLLQAIANVLATIAPLTKRLHSEQSDIVATHALVQNAHDEYDGSVEHKNIVRQHHENGDFIGADALAQITTVTGLCSA